MEMVPFLLLWHYLQLTGKWSSMSPWTPTMSISITSQVGMNFLSTCGGMNFLSASGGQVHKPYRTNTVNQCVAMWHVTQTSLLVSLAFKTGIRGSQDFLKGGHRVPHSPQPLRDFQYFNKSKLSIFCAWLLLLQATHIVLTVVAM